MGIVAPVLASSGALLLGLLLVASGIYVRRGGRLRYRQGAEVLAGLVMVIGAALIALSALILVLDG